MLRNRKGNSNIIIKTYLLQFIKLIKATLPENTLTDDEIKILKNVQRVNGFAGISVFPCANSKKDVKILTEFGPGMYWYEDL